MSKRVLKWDVPVDDAEHRIGAGPVLHVACQGPWDVVQVWTEEPDVPTAGYRVVRVHGTGHPVRDFDVHLGSVVVPNGPVWHVYGTPGTHGSQRDG